MQYKVKVKKEKRERERGGGIQNGSRYIAQTLSGCVCGGVKSAVVVSTSLNNGINGLLLQTLVYEYIFVPKLSCNYLYQAQQANSLDTCTYICTHVSLQQQY